MAAFVLGGLHTLGQLRLQFLAEEHSGGGFTMLAQTGLAKQSVGLVLEIQVYVYLYRRDSPAERASCRRPPPRRSWPP